MTRLVAPCWTRLLAPLALALASGLTHAGTDALPPGLVFAGLHDGAWAVYRVDSDGEPQPLALDEEARALAPSPNGERLAYIAIDGSIRVHEPASERTHTLVPGGGEDAYTDTASDLRPLTVSLEVVEGAEVEQDGLPVIDGPATFRVHMAEGDRERMEGRQYEVAFLHNYEFVAEEESGYSPISWRWSGEGAEPGINTMVVNIIGVGGRVGRAGVRFRVPEPDD